MRKKLEIGLVFGCMVAITMLFVFGPKEKISLSEKRTLATLPTLTWDTYISGAFSKGVQLYINDHFPFRAQAVRLTEAFRYNLGFQLQNQEKIVVVGNPKKIQALEDSNLDSAAQKAYLEGFEEFDASSVLILNGKIYTTNSGDPAISPYFAKMLNVYAKQS